MQVNKKQPLVTTSKAWGYTCNTESLSNILIGCIVYKFNPGYRKLELVCIDMYDEFKSTVEKSDFVLMLFLKVKFKYL